MARFNISICTNVDYDSINICGSKERDSVIAKVNGIDEAMKFDYFYIRKPNKYGIKWVICYKNSNKVFDISSSKRYSNIKVIKL